MLAFKRVFKLGGSVTVLRPFCGDSLLDFVKVELSSFERHVVLLFESGLLLESIFEDLDFSVTLTKLTGES